MIKESIAGIGENIQIRRFERYVLGEGISVAKADLAADVEAQTKAMQASRWAGSYLGACVLRLAASCWLTAGVEAQASVCGMCRWDGCISAVSPLTRPVKLITCCPTCLVSTGGCRQEGGGRAQEGGGPGRRQARCGGADRGNSRWWWTG